MEPPSSPASPPLAPMESIEPPSSTASLPLSRAWFDDDDDNNSRGDDAETRPRKRSSSCTLVTRLDNTTEISYQYLTFQTALPAPNTHHAGEAATAGKEAAAPFPRCEPDLTPFTDPLLWPERRKTLLLVLSCVATFLTAYTAGAYSPPSALIASRLGTSQDAVLAGISTFCAGFGLAPMMLAPLSEINGRYPVFVASGIVYVVSQVACGLLTHSLAGLLVARLLVGIGGSVFSTMVGGVITDLWDADGRNTPMAIFSGTVLVGTGAGPLVAAVLTQRLGGEGEEWTWVFWHQAIAATVVMIALVILFKESRGSVLLSRKAKALNRWYGELERAGYYGVWTDDAEATGEPQPGTVTDDESDSRSEKTAAAVAAAGEISSSSASSHSQSGSCCSSVTLSPAHTPQRRRRLQRVRWLVKADEERASVAKMISVSVYRPLPPAADGAGGVLLLALGSLRVGGALPDLQLHLPGVWRRVRLERGAKRPRVRGHDRRVAPGHGRGHLPRPVAVPAAAGLAAGEQVALALLGLHAPPLPSGRARGAAVPDVPDVDGAAG